MDIIGAGTGTVATGAAALATTVLYKPLAKHNLGFKVNAHEIEHQAMKHIRFYLFEGGRVSHCYQFLRVYVSFTRAPSMGDTPSFVVALNLNLPKVVLLDTTFCIL